MVEIKDTEPECFQRLMLELQNIKSPYNQCVQPYQFGAINAITNILKNKYIDAKKGKRKIFISHSHSDKTIVDGFVKEILKVGCGFKDSDLFCTLDTSTIRTGDDFREKIIENMRDCDFIFLPKITFEQMGFLNVVKQGASITDGNKLDELYQELCEFYEITPDWRSFNKAKGDFLDLVAKA